MATLYITEYTRLARDNLQNAMPAGAEPGITQTLPIGDESVPSRMFLAAAQFVRVIADEPCHLAFGDDPTADTSCMLLPTNEPEFVARLLIAASERLARLARRIVPVGEP